jgi:hypothetical protein
LHSLHTRSSLPHFQHQEAYPRFPFASFNLSTLSFPKPLDHQSPQLHFSIPVRFFHFDPLLHSRDVRKEDSSGIALLRAFALSSTCRFPTITRSTFFFASSNFSTFSIPQFFYTPSLQVTTSASPCRYGLSGIHPLYRPKCGKEEMIAKPCIAHHSRHVFIIKMPLSSCLLLLVRNTLRSNLSQPRVRTILSSSRFAKSIALLLTEADWRF